MGWRRWRDRWLGDPRVRAAIGRSAVGRQVAARHARDLFGTVAGFVRSQWLAAAVELGVLERLLAGERRWEEIVDLPPRGARALREGLLATGLIEERGSRVGLTVAGLVVASDLGLRAMIAHNRLLYADLADPAALLRRGGGGAVAAFWPYADGDGAPEAYSELMAASSAASIAALLACGALARATHVMDVGGGDGAALRALAARRPSLRLTLVDLPAVVARARLPESAKAVGVEPGAPLPRGADLATLVRVLHDHDDDAAAALLGRVAAALPAGGRLVVVEPTARAGRDAQTAYFAAYFAAMGSGRLRRADDLATLLRDAGLTGIKRDFADPLTTMIVATKP